MLNNFFLWLDNILNKIVCVYKIKWGRVDHGKWYFVHESRWFAYLFEQVALIKQTTKHGDDWYYLDGLLQERLHGQKP